MRISLEQLLNTMVFENVNAEALANIYFDGKVTSHSLTTQEGDKITIGLIYPGEYHFDTDLAERMEIISGKPWHARVYLSGPGFWALVPYPPPPP